MPRFNRVFGLVEANGYKFGWYWDCDQINMGYSSGEAYIFTINNCYQTLVQLLINLANEIHAEIGDAKIQCLSVGTENWIWEGWKRSDTGLREFEGMSF